MVSWLQQTETPVEKAPERRFFVACAEHGLSFCIRKGNHCWRGLREEDAFLGAVISIGLVYPKRGCDLSLECNKLINVLHKTYSTTVTRNIRDLNPIFDSQVVLFPIIYQSRKLSTIMRALHRNDLNGILLDFSEEEIIPVHNEENLIQAEDFLIKLIKEITPDLKFSYAFCDHEAEITYAPENFFQFDTPVHSLEFIPIEAGMIIRKSKWHIDGHTERIHYLPSLTDLSSKRDR